MQLPLYRFFFFLFVVAFAAATSSADTGECKERRQRASKAFSAGILLLHSKTTTNDADDGYREEPAFYYLTGLENSPSAILAIDGRNGDSWLFLNTKRSGDVQPGAEAERKLDIQHVVDWSELSGFLSRQIAKGTVIYFEPGLTLLPENLSVTNEKQMPTWVQVLQKKWPTAQFRSVGRKLDTLMAVESSSELRASRVAARASVAAFIAGAKAVRPGMTQREVELAIIETCWKVGARGVSFWPWAMAGANSVFPKPFESDSRYDHLDATVRDGDLMRLDVGCEWEHYQGDLGRTIPVSGRYTEEQREVWNIFVAAYQKAASEMKEGLTEDQVFDIWRSELRRKGEAAKTSLAKEAVANWSERKNVPYWQMHTMNLGAGYIEGPLRAGMVIDFEPIVSIAGQGYYLEDMYLIGKTDAEVLTPSLPYSAEEIESFLASK
jgi:Xaa-Pro aminopeptidase